MNMKNPNKVVAEDNQFHSVVKARHLGIKLRHHADRLYALRDAVQAERRWLMLGGHCFEDHDAMVCLMQRQEPYLEGMLGTVPRTSRHQHMQHTQRTRHIVQHAIILNHAQRRWSSGRAK
jgi:hypothetical protein